MTKYQKRHRIIACFFLLIFFPTILPNNLFASNNGPVAPEATSFEPVDATDMVNLSSGDMSYVLPILNVPSPEGGYPLALSYHAGLAMDQEASWVGLGWSLNPGAINRSVKGVPDDWDKTRITELLYDEGQTLNYYNFSIGGTLPNGITIGMSRSWGAHKAWGGTVGYVGMGNVGFGSEEISVSAGGVSVGYNLDSKKISGSYTLSASGATNNGLTITSSGQLKASALGVSYNTVSDKVTSQNFNSSSNNNTPASASDYYVNNYDRGFDVDAAGFYWISYQHTHIEYSLFKLTSNHVSGTLNLFDTKKENQYLQDHKYYMDVRSHDIIDRNRPTSPNGYGQSAIVEVTLPNYDNYAVTAQGISGSFSPKTYDEVMLYGKGEESNKKYLTSPVNTDYDNAFKLNNKLFFYFNNVNSSFLRTQTGDFKSLDSTFNLDNNTVDSNGVNEAGRFVNNIVTDNDNTFTSPYNKDGELTKVGNRKRDGQYIEAFTNKEIIEGKTSQGPFLEVSGYDRLAYKNIAENGIGAYRVTALDGKVYHYSLPVYSYEEVYKNYSNASNENDKFLETIKSKPYATHWLLTAITGPDYIDINNNNMVDKNDYGYYVEFEYGKWSEGYGWRSPKIGGKVYNNKYLYFWGRKEIYYLDKIKTRTHTALFVKSIRNDDKSTSIQYRNGQYQSGPMSADLTQNFIDKLERPIEQGNYYAEPQANTYKNTNYNSDSNKRHGAFKYVDLPENLSLKLDRIILLKNNDALSINKNSGTGTNRKKGCTYFDFGFWVNFGLNNHYLVRKNPYDVKTFNINSDQNILDEQDIDTLNKSQGFDILNKAVKVVSLKYDYSLGSNLPNSTSGRLALRNLEFIGKNNIKSIPPYQFNYSKSSTPYNFTNSDNWGYVKNNPDAWSLNEIITPTGAKIKIDYEPDSFTREAAFKTETETQSADRYTVVPNAIFNNAPVKYTIQNNIITINTNFKYYSDNLNDVFSLGQEVNLSFQFKIPHATKYNEFLNNYTIIGIDNASKKITLKPNDRTDINLQKRFFEGPFCSITSGNGHFETYQYKYSVPNVTEYAYGFRIIANYNRLIAQFGRNGKEGGGLRVKRITTSDFTNENHMITEYDYRNPYSTNGSGVTSFEPSDNPQVADKIQAVEEIPSPDVQYEYVTATVKNNSEKLSSTLFNFKVMDDITLSDAKEGEYEYKFGDQFSIKFFGGSRREYNANLRKVSTAKIILYDNFSSLGNLLDIKIFNSKQQLMSHTINKYKEFQSDDIENGISQESFKYGTQDFTTRQTWDAQGNNVANVRDYRYTFTSIGKTSMPSRLESTTTIKGGWSNTNFYDKYDFLTGQPTETRNLTSTGESFKTKIIPARLKLKYKEMGSKADNAINKNMLSQVAATYSYIFDKNDSNKPWKETGVGITTWNNIWAYKDITGNRIESTAPKEKIWRKHKSYIWNGTKDENGIFMNYISDNDDNFNWDVPIGVGINVTQPAKWKQISEITLYDHYSAPLETKDINNNYAATKMGDEDSKVIASGNSGHSEMFYSGAENTPLKAFPTYLEPEINMINASINSTYQHTGKYAVAATSSSKFGVTMRDKQHRAGKYRVSVWVEKTNATKARINNNGTIVNFTETYNAGNWVLKTGYISNVPTTEYSINVTSLDASTVYFDDLMIRPIASSITGYVYNEWDELTFIIGNNGLATKFEYDAGGRLIKTSIEVVDDSANGVTGGFKITKTNVYNNRYLN